jgi:hypothetical protein
MQWMGLALRKGTMNIPCIAFLNRPCFHFPVLESKTDIFEGCYKDMKFARRELNNFIDFSCFMAPENAKIFQVLQCRSDFIMQNYYVKSWSYFYTTLQN